MLFQNCSYNGYIIHCALILVLFYFFCPLIFMESTAVSNVHVFHINLWWRKHAKGFNFWYFILNILIQPSFGLFVFVFICRLLCACMCLRALVDVDLCLFLWLFISLFIWVLVSVWWCVCILNVVSVYMSKWMWFFLCMCVCVCVFLSALVRSQLDTYQH